MLLSEVMRRIQAEETLYSDPNSYGISALSDWVTVKDVNISLGEAAIIHFAYTVEAYTDGGYVYGNGRLLIDGTPICPSGEITRITSGTASRTMSGRIYLESGAHTFTFQVSIHRFEPTTTGSVSIKNIDIRKFNFSHIEKLNVNSGWVSVPYAYYEATIINQNITMPTKRIVAGWLKQIPIWMILHMEVGDYRYSVVRNPGESDVSGRWNWKLYINDVQVAWSGRVDDQVTGYTSNSSYSEGAYGAYECIGNAGETINIKVKVYNNTIYSRNVRAVLTLIACPWIIPSGEYQPLSLSFPQGSTLYVVLEPLSSDPSKTLKLGKKRVWSFGDSTDYYSTASGTGILSWNYTFEIIEPSSCLLLIGGSGGCVSAIAVDLR